MVKNYAFAIEDVRKIQITDYEDDEFAIARMGFLSTRPNAHELHIGEDVLRKSAPSVLGKWLVADMTGVLDAGTHTKNEHIVGQIPKDQDVEFVYDDDGYLRAYVDVVISKVYAADYCAIFENDNNRSVSVEMKVTSADDDESEVLSFTIVGVTTLGKAVRPSCPQSDITITRFSESDATNFFNKVHNASLTELQKFAEERKRKMATSYKIDKSKEAVSDKPWGDVDKSAMRDKIMEASNRATLVKAVYAKVEEGWQDAPSEHLKFPIMELKGDTFVYNRNALASALGYAKKENETEVVSKIEKIYKSLDLDGKEDTTKMSKEIEFAAVNIGDMWGKLWDALHAKYPDGDWGSVYRIDGIYEEDNKKFAIIHHKDDDAKYRLDFSLTEEGLTLAEEIVKVELEIVETDEVKKFAEPENADKYKKFEEKDDKQKDDEDDDDDDKDDEDEDVEMSADEMKAEMARLQSEIENRDNIIMEKDAELEELRQFKAGVEKEKQAMSVEALMAEVKEFIDGETYKKFRDEGLACNMSELDAWSNKVKAFCFENGKKSNAKKNDGLWSFAAPITQEHKSSSVWDYLKK